MKFKMPQFKMPEWAANAGWGLALVGIVIGGIVMVAGMIVTAVVLLTTKIFIGAAFRAAIAWLAWTYSGFGQLFADLPAHLQQIDYLYIFCGMVIWQLLFMSIRRALGLHPFPTINLKAKQPSRSRGVTRGLGAFSR